MHIVHIDANQQQKAKRYNISQDKHAIKAGLLAWKIKHNERFEKK